MHSTLREPHHTVFQVLGTQMPHAWFWPLDGKLPLQWVVDVGETRMSA